MAVEIVGRDEELGALDGFLGRRAAPGLAALVLEGEAGIGKSTLWLAGVEAARERGLRVLSSRPAEVELGVAHAGLGDLLEDTLADVLDELPAPRRRALEIALLVRDDANEQVDFRTLAVAVRTALQLLAERKPVLVAIDDVQWLDPSSASALAFALRRLADEDIRILLAHRLGDGMAVSELEHALDESRTTRLRVGPLSAGALHGILQQQLGRGFARPTLLRLQEASGGNPFFVLALARSIGPDGGSGDPSRPLRLPEAIEELIHTRLAELPESSRAALLIVAAAGRPTRALLRAAEVDDRALEPALAAGVIAPAGEGVVFTHPLLASVLYQRAHGSERRLAHRVLAALVDDSVARARHLGLSADSPDLETAAVLEEAAAVALARGAPIVAAELGEQALRVTTDLAPEDRHRRSLAAAHAHVAAGEEERPRAIARELLSTALEGPARAEALALMADLDALDSAVGLLEEAVLEAAPRPALQARLHLRLAGLGRLIRGLTWSEGHALAALRLAEQLDDDALRAGSLSVLALVRFNRGDEDAPRLAQRGYELALVCDDREQLRAAGWALSHLLTWSVSTDKARALLEARYEKERQWDERGSAEPLWYLSFVELRAGRWQVASEYAERVLEIESEYGSPHAPAFFPVALIAAHRGEVKRAVELAVSGRELADREGTPLLAGLVALQGVLAVWSGDAVAAVGWFAAAEEKADAAEWHEPNLRWWRADYVEALLELGRTSEAVVVLDAWCEDAVRVDRAWVLAQVTRCRGLIAAAAGDVGQAIATLTEAAGEHEEVGDPFGHARALLALGVIRRRARQKRLAREAIEAALAGFEALGAAGWAEKARAELGRVGGRTRVEGLTPAERRVATLAAEGRTNREVAAALFLAEPTVASHLSHVYAKLGVRSRTELARKLQPS
jgi:DNA-binding CsgD family transcriptional regulator